MFQSLRQVRQIRIAEFINKIVATRRFEKGRNAKKWIFGWILNIEFWISGLSKSPPAKTNSHLLLWWSWTLREGRKWPFHLICLSSQQFVKFNWNALVREKVLNKRWKQFCHQGARCAPRPSDVRRPSTPWPPPRRLHQVGPRVLDI